MILKVNSNNELLLSPKSYNKTLTLGTCHTEFTTYMDVYFQKYPDEASGLLANMSVIRDLKRGFGQAAFTYYDRSFRAHRLSQPLQWGSLPFELGLSATLAPRNTLVRSDTRQNH